MLGVLWCPLAITGTQAANSEQLQILTFKTYHRDCYRKYFMPNNIETHITSN